MRLTVSQLRRIIKEEVSSVMEAQGPADMQAALVRAEDAAQALQGALEELRFNYGVAEAEVMAEQVGEMLDTLRDLV